MIFYFVGCTSEELTSARLYIQQKNWEKAEEYLLKAMEVEPENPEVFYSLGKYIYAKKKDWENMNKMFDLDQYKKTLLLFLQKIKLAHLMF